MPDVVAVIKAQHKVIDSLLTQAEAEGADVKALMQQVADLLKPHSEAEESFVYPAIRNKQADETAMVKDGVAEHHHLEGLLDQLLVEDPEEPGYDGKLAALIGELRHHVEEEEQDLLPVLEKKAGEQEREAMGRRFLEETGQSDGGAGSDAGPASSGSSGSGSDEPTKAELYEKAKEQDVEGRSTMTKDELKQALEGQG
ncbi:MAG TPA: hemerythrin domain-containing protein [Actinomycetales bacterium]|nr:hemerythrin domain-containing protein [Actinomycetales bacterium]